MQTQTANAQTALAPVAAPLIHRMWAVVIKAVGLPLTVAWISLSTLIASPPSSVSAEQPPRKGCIAVPKIEYASAAREKLLRNRNGAYVRTGRIWQRYYWYCH